MTVRLNAATLRAVFPKAPDAIIAAFVTHQDVLAEVCETRQRLAYMLANVHHETAGFTIKNLTENINYTATRMAAVWPSRFKSAAAVQAKYGTASGWQRQAFNDIYGGRMGNRPGTNDGSQYIGRGGPQVTGRDGYLQIGTRIGVDLLSVPERASDPDLQPAICAAFWSWKGLSVKADAGDFLACVKLWNGGTIGLADRQAQLARIAPILAKAETVPTVPSKPAAVKPAAPVTSAATKPAAPSAPEKKPATTAKVLGAAAGVGIGTYAGLHLSVPPAVVIGGVVAAVAIVATVIFVKGRK